MKDFFVRLILLLFISLLRSTLCFKKKGKDCELLGCSICHIDGSTCIECLNDGHWTLVNGHCGKSISVEQVELSLNFC